MAGSFEVQALPKFTSHIDLECDQLEPVSLICKQRTGKAASPATIWRWRLKGVRGVKLEAVLVKGCWCTTAKAFAAFIAGQTAAALNSSRATDSATSHERDSATEQRLRNAKLI